MNISNPTLPAHIKQSAHNIVDALYESNFAHNNVDLNIDVIGILNYTTGVKLRFTFADTFLDDDVDEWRVIARQYGASGIKTKVDTSTGNIDMNIEYKRRGAFSKIWMIRSALVALASFSYHQLHLLNVERYPLPSLG